MMLRFITIFLISFSVQWSTLNAQDTWKQASISSLKSLSSQPSILLHPSFIIDEANTNNSIIHTDNFYTGFIFFKIEEQTILICKLAEDNFLKMNVKFESDTKAAIYDISCECNLGIERSIFNHNPNPSKEKIADIELKNGKILFTYSEHFIHSFLDLSPFAKEFFKDSFSAYIFHQE